MSEKLTLEIILRRKGMSEDQIQDKVNAAGEVYVGPVPTPLEETPPAPVPVASFAVKTEMDEVKNKKHK